MLNTLFTLFLFATAALAQLTQSVFISLPTPNQTVVVGESFVVQIQLPDTLSEYEPVAIALGLQTCPCYNPAGDMGTILFYGLYQPQFYNTNLPYENYTVTVPSSTATGAGILTVAYFSLDGLALAPTIETLNQTLTIVS